VAPSNIEEKTLRDRRKTQALPVFRSKERLAFLFLIGGFLLTIVLLALDALVGFHGEASTRESLSAIAENQLLNVVLIGQIQQLHSVLNSIGQRAPGRNPLDQSEREEIHHIERAVKDLSATVPLDSPDIKIWSDIQSKVASIVEETDRMQALPPGQTVEAANLAQAGQQVALATANLIQSTFKRAQETKLQVEKATRRQSVEDRVLLAGCLVVAFVLFLTGTRIYYRMNEQAHELSSVSWQLLEKQESLARRLSHELHDELGQSLTALKTNFSQHASLKCSEPSWMADCTDLLKDSMRSAHEISQLLRPTILDDFGLDSALAWLCERFEERNRVKVRYVSNFRDRLDEQAETHLFRIAQEALTNVARHAHATVVNVQLAKRNEVVDLTISDNGAGFTSTLQHRSQSFGLTGMKARARSLNGTMKIRTRAGHGTLVEVSFPLLQTAHEETNSHLVG
jgi:signal transduction histidine kinase